VLLQLRLLLPLLLQRSPLPRRQGSEQCSYTNPLMRLTCGSLFSNMPSHPNSNTTQMDQQQPI